MIPDGHVLIVVDQLQQEFYSGHALLPILRLHRGRYLRVVIKDGGANGELDLDGYGGPELVLFADSEKFRQELNLFLAVGALLAYEKGARNKLKNLGPILSNV